MFKEVFKDINLKILFLERNIEWISYDNRIVRFILKIIKTNTFVFESVERIIAGFMLSIIIRMCSNVSLERFPKYMGVILVFWFAQSGVIRP